MKHFRHFAKQRTVLTLITEIKNRHLLGYKSLIEAITAQMIAYFLSQFPHADLAAGRSRFAGKEDSLIRPRFLVGLSGGIDSSVVTALAVRAVGIDAVLPITMPARPDDAQSMEMAKLLRGSLGYDENKNLPYLIDIEPIVRAHIQVMTALPQPQIQLGGGYYQQNQEEKMRSGNFASRMRTAVLYDFARSVRGRILGTVNRTEFCQGYNAKYGTPISYDFGVLNELYKIDIDEIAKIVGLPAEILDAAPTTGYFEGQTHEGELGATIEEQDIFAYLLFEKNLSPASVVREYGASPEFVEIMRYRYEVCAHKRVLNELQAQVRLKR
jgi:NAD+ synthase